MEFKLRNAHIDDLDQLVRFITAEADEAEGISKSPDTIRNGIKTGLENTDIARYWVIEGTDGSLIGRVSVIQERSDWNLFLSFQPANQNKLQIMAFDEKIDISAIDCSLYGT